MFKKLDFFGLLLVNEIDRNVPTEVVAHMIGIASSSLGRSVADVSKLSCLDRDLATGRSPVQDVLQTA
jgi:hypothetical protein